MLMIKLQKSGVASFFFNYFTEKIVLLPQGIYTIIGTEMHLEMFSASLIIKLNITLINLQIVIRKK